MLLDLFVLFYRVVGWLNERSKPMRDEPRLMVVYEVAGAPDVNCIQPEGWQ